MADIGVARIGAIGFQPRSALYQRYWVLAVLTLVYAINVADRFVLSTLIEPIKAEFHLSDSGVGFLTGVVFALFYGLAGLPLGRLADRAHRRNMILWSLAIWSLFVALCGVAHSFGQLLAARIGVGLGEAGATPSSQSILADYFPPTKRATAMSIFVLGVAIGSGIGGIVGGMLADSFGWRTCLVIFGCASAPVLILLLAVQEPGRGAGDRLDRAGARKTPDLAGAAHPTLRETLRFIRGQRALLHILAGATIADFAGGGLIWWTPAFLGRSHGYSVSQAGMHIGLMTGLGGAAALVATTFIMIRLSRHDTRLQCLFLAGVTLLITLPAVAAYAVSNSFVALVLLWLFVPFTNVHLGATFALLQNLAPPTMRGVTVAIFLFTANIANLAIAPQLIGFASDVLAAQIADPAQSLRFALAISGLTGFWAAFHFWAARRTMAADLERARIFGY